MGRPTGVTVIAVLYFLGAALCVLGGIGMIAGGGLLAKFMSQAGGENSGVGAGALAAVGAVAGVFFLIFAAIDFLVGWGLLKLKGWARIIAIVLAALGILGSLPGLLGTLSHFHLASLVWTLAWLAYFGWTIWYLLQPNVSAAFRGQAGTAAA